MSGAILMATNSTFQKGITCCRSIYVRKVIRLLAFLFEHPSYLAVSCSNCCSVYIQLEHGLNIESQYNSLEFLQILLLAVANVKLFHHQHKRVKPRP